jgi:ubiquinone/menaquinone biosynthesis C-methylase UbiE
MSSSLTEIAWPAPTGHAEPPRWDGEYFVVGNERRKVLCYESAPSHWTPDLTVLHEAEAGLHHPIDQASRHLAVESIRRFGRPHDPVILDVGCSSGFLLEALRRTIAGATLIGADVILPPLMTLADRLSGVPLLQFDLQRCPLPDECVDAVTVLNVLEHIEHDDVALRQIWRILKPGGVAHVEVPAGPHLYDIYDEQLLHYRRYRLHRLVDQARDAGFHTLKATHLGAWVYPAFRMVKRKNRRLRQLAPLEKEHMVADQIRQTAGNRLLRTVLKLELAVGQWISYPMGIRCVVALQKRNGGKRPPNPTSGSRADTR